MGKIIGTMVNLSKQSHKVFSELYYILKSKKNNYSKPHLNPECSKNCPFLREGGEIVT